MKHPRVLPLALFATAMSSVALAADFHDHLGLQLWSLRAQLKPDVPAALDLAKGYGVKEVETITLANAKPAELSALLKARGLEAVSAHIGYDALKKDINAAIADAKTLGVHFLICPSLPHGKAGFKEADAHRVAAEFNAWGEACRAAGLQFGYHPHGFEFTPTEKGQGEVVFDVLVRETKPDLVCYEMDVFWVAHAGQDPVALLQKYPNRWRLMHVKDMRRGAPTGFATGSAPATDNVAVGAGQIDWPQVLRTGEKIGVRYYFLEDETPTPLECIPESLKYLRALKL